MIFRLPIPPQQLQQLQQLQPLMFKDPRAVWSHNTLHSFNPHTQDGYLLGCIDTWYPRELCKYGTELLYSCRKCTGCKKITKMNKVVAEDLISDHSGVKVSIISTYAGDYVRINTIDHCNIKKVIDAVINTGYTIKLQTQLAPLYTPDGPEFNIENSEQLALISLTQFLNKGCMLDYISRNGWRLGDVRLWKTDQGKEFAAKVLEKCPECREDATSDLYLPAKTLDPNIEYPLVSTH